MASIKTLDKKSSVVLNIIKGSFWGVAFSLVCILIFAFILKYTAISENVIQPINQVIKGLSILVACWVVGKNIKNNGWLWGLITGFVYTILAFIIFSILDGSFNLGVNVINDIIFGTIGGAIAGIICISFRK